MEAKNGTYAARVIVGQPIGSFYGYRYPGVYQNTDATYARDAEGQVMNDANGKPIVMKKSDSHFVSREMPNMKMSPP